MSMTWRVLSARPYNKLRRGRAYAQLFGYLLFMAIYMFVVYVQSDVLNAYTAGTSAWSAP